MNNIGTLGLITILCTGCVDNINNFAIDKLSTDKTIDAVETTELEFTSSTTLGITDNQRGVVYIAQLNSIAHGPRYSISGGADAALLIIDPATGEITFLQPPDDDVPQDADKNNIYEVEVTGKNSAEESVSALISISITATDDAPLFSSSTTGSIDENTTHLSYTAIAIDPEGGELRYAIVGGTHKDLFEIDALTGVLLLRQSLDFESNNAPLQIQISATDASGQSVTQSVSLIINNVLEAPFFTSTNSGSVAENSSLTTYIATAIDPEGNAIVYSIHGGVDSAAFTINPDTGVLSLISPLDFESDSTPLSVDIKSTDSTGNFALQTVNIALTDVAEAPVFTSENSGNVAENSNLTTYTATAIDPEGNAIVYSIHGGIDSAAFTINPDTGVLSLISPLDFESDTTPLSVDIKSTDSTGNSALQTVSIALTDVAEAPVFTSTNTQLNMQENLTYTGYTAEAIDPDNNNVTFSISGGEDQSIFSINSNSGALSFSLPPDFENPSDFNADNIYHAIISAADAGDLSDDQAVQVAVTNENQLSLLVDFPLPNSRLHGRVTNQEVFGRLIDTEDGVVDTPVVTVNSQSAVITGEKWRASVPVAIGDTVLQIDATAANAEVQNTSFTVNNDYNIGSYVTIDSANQRVFTYHRDTDSIISVDLATQATQLISSPTKGIGPTLITSSVSAPMYHPGNNALYVLSGGENLYKIDIATGNRTVISDINSVGGSLLTVAVGGVLDILLDRLITTQFPSGNVISIDLSTGDRTIFSTAVEPHNPARLAIDSATNLLVSYHSRTREVFSFDLTTAMRTTLVTSNALGRIYGLVIDSINSLAIVNASNALIGIDLTTKATTMLSDTNTGTGPALFGSLKAYDPVNRSVLMTDRGNVLSVDTITGNRSVLYQEVPTPEIIKSPKYVVLDKTNNRLLANAYNGLYAIDLDTRVHTTIASSTIGTGPAVYSGHLIPDITNQRVFTHNQNTIVEINLLTGDRTVLSDSTTGSGPAPTRINSIDYDNLNNRLILVDDTLNAILTLNLSTLVRTIISDASIGTGASFTEPREIAYHSATDTAYIVDRFSSVGLFSVDMVTGDRTPVSTSTLGSGPNVTENTSYRTTDMRLDLNNNRIFVLSSDISNIGEDTLFKVNTLTGDRSIVMDATGQGTSFSYPNGMAYDAEKDVYYMGVGSNPGFIIMDPQTGDRALITP